MDKVTANTQPVRILIVGAGAVGCFYGSRMHHPPNALVSLVCRSNFNAIKRSGVKLQTRNFGDYIFNPEFVFSSIEEASEARVQQVPVPVSVPVTSINSDRSLSESEGAGSTSYGSNSGSARAGGTGPTTRLLSSSLTFPPSPTFPHPRPHSDVPAAASLASLAYPHTPSSSSSTTTTSKPSTTGTKITWDYVVITTKALPDVSDDSSLITLVVQPRITAIVLIQNGVGVEDPYCVRFPENCVLSAVTVVSAEQIQPGVIVQNRWTRISIGPYGAAGANDGIGKARTEEFVQLLKLGGVKDAEVYSEKALQQVRWHKIAINGSMNPSAVLSSGTENARMVKDPELRIHLRACMEEVFHAAHVVLGEPLPSHLATADQIITSTERNTGGRPSMLVDWEKGSSMELEVILGNPIRIARSKGVEMPRLQAMYALLKAAQERRSEERKKKKSSSSNQGSASTSERSRL